MKNLFLGFTVLLSMVLLSSCNKKENSGSVDDTLLNIGECGDFVNGVSNFTTSCLITSESTSGFIGSTGSGETYSCSYGFDRLNSDDKNMGVALNISRYKSVSFANVSLDAFIGAFVGDVETISGVGDEAYYSANPYESGDSPEPALIVRKNNIIIACSTTDDDDNECSIGTIKSDLITLANKALDRIDDLNE